MRIDASYLCYLSSYCTLCTHVLMRTEIILCSVVGTFACLLRTKIIMFD
jgi:hypothetical protein